MIDYLKLIAKDFSGELNFTEAEKLKKWINESKENELFYRRFRELWQDSQHRPYVQNQEEVFQKITRELGIRYPDKHKADHQKTSWTKYWRSIAASIVLLIITGSYFFILPVEENTTVEVHSTVIKSTPSGKKSLITLPDGSVVKLNAESYLEYPEKFSDERQVKLVGEAFFEVQKDSLHPFIVLSGDIQVKVLGTSFNVQAFPFEESMSVAVASGRVLVEKKNKQNSKQTSTLLPSEMVSIDHKTGIFQKSHFDPNVLAWRDGILAFEKAKFNEIMIRLERWYGVDIIVERTSPISDGFTGRYENATLEAVLQGMSFSSDFSFHVEGDKVFIN